MTNTKSKAVFFDKYGTLIQNFSQGYNTAEIKLLPGAARAINQIKQLGCKAIMVSNEPAVAAGMISVEQLESLNSSLQKTLEGQDALLNGVYYCPFDPDAAVTEFAHKSQLKIPAPGMLLKAAEELDIDLKNSWVVGDSLDDIRAGIAAGCKTILIRPTARKRPTPQDGTEANYEAVNITEATNYIKMKNRKQNIQQTLEFEPGNESEDNSPSADPEGKTQTDHPEKTAKTEFSKDEKDSDAKIASNVGKCFVKMGTASKGRELLIKKSGLFASEEQQKAKEAKHTKDNGTAAQDAQPQMHKQPVAESEQKPEPAQPNTTVEASQQKPAETTSADNIQRPLPEAPLEDANKLPNSTKEKSDNDVEIFQFITGMFQAAAVLMFMMMIFTIIKPNLTPFSVMGLLVMTIVSQVLSVAFARIKPSR